MNDPIFKLTYFSLGHILSIIVPIFLIVMLFFLLRNASTRTQKAVILTIMLINVFQHVFKAWVWYPMYHGKFDPAMSFFANICGSVILLSPFIFLGKNDVLKDGLFLLGNLCAIVSTWFITITYGISFLHIEYIRYFTAHCLLMITSSLPVLLGLHTVNVRNFWAIGLFYIALETIVFLDNFVNTAAKVSWDWAKAYATIYKANKLFIMKASGPEVFDHTFLAGTKIKYVIDDGTITYVPVLWSAPAIWLGLSVLSWVVFKICAKLHIDGYYLGYSYKKVRF